MIVLSRSAYLPQRRRKYKKINGCFCGADCRMKLHFISFAFLFIILKGFFSVPPPQLKSVPERAEGTLTRNTEKGKTAWGEIFLSALNFQNGR